MPSDTLKVSSSSAHAEPGAGVSIVEGARSSAEWLIDNEVAYEAVIAAIRRARRSVCISQLAFDADCEAYSYEGPPVRVLDALVEAWSEHTLDVRVLLNATLLVDTARPLRKALAEKGASAIQVRGIRRFPQLLHAKILIIDDSEAFLLGSPFVNGYWDDTTHRPDDVRRPMRELGGRPLHDLSVRMQGPVVAEFQAGFEDLWSESVDGDGDGGLVAVGAVRPQASNTVDGSASLKLTTPAGGRAREGRTEILPAMLRGIHGARELLYVEHQYLSSRRVVRAIANALEREPQLEIVALVNQNPDVTAYRGWQNQRMEESGLAAHPRFGLFALWTSSSSNGRLAVNQVFVHSKLITADDRWATFGSANIDGVSLHSYGADFRSALGRRIFRNVRNFDANVEMQSVTDRPDVSIADLRTSLWTEHLGLMPSVRPAEGWLHLWRMRAAENIAALNAYRGDSSHEAGTFVLPYSTAPTPAGQLRALGVIDREELDLRFRPSWLEVHCSPNWIRNMFA
ncbi:MAG: phospholipase D-like domain-containing protein [Gemmatimonadota bacterium]|nr:phospholipase D-like domain-containing protein [Gemmatimonadota bacterium]